jgi:hypothetical protein
VVQRRSQDPSTDGRDVAWNIVDSTDWGQGAQKKRGRFGMPSQLPGRQTDDSQSQGPYRRALCLGNEMSFFDVPPSHPPGPSRVVFEGLLRRACSVAVRRSPLRGIASPYDCCPMALSPYGPIACRMRNSVFVGTRRWVTSLQGQWTILDTKVGRQICRAAGRLKSCSREMRCILRRHVPSIAKFRSVVRQEERRNSKGCSSHRAILQRNSVSVDTRK